MYATLGLTAGWLLVAAGSQGSWGRLAWTFLAAEVTEAVFAVLAVASPGSIGFGDVRLVGLIGVGVGWVGPLLIAVAVSAGIAAAGVVALAGVAAGRLSGRNRLPLGAFLAAAAVVTVAVRG